MDYKLLVMFDIILLVMFRGGIQRNEQYGDRSDYGLCEKHESTFYSGSHSVQCFIIKKGICVAKSEEFIVNVR